MADEDLLDSYRHLLTSEELERGTRFRFERDRRCYLVTRALVRTVLSRYAPVEPADWRFGRGRFGRPFIIAPTAFPGIAFNLSHSGDLIGLAVAGNRRIGLDVERRDRASSALPIAERFFAPPEAASLRALAAEDQPQRFIELWTLKEAYIKARGRGLGIPLDSFAFDIRPGSVDFAPAPGCHGFARGWEFRQFELASGHVAAVCAETRDDTPIRLRLRRTVPLREEEEWSVPEMRAGCWRRGSGGMPKLRRP